MTRTAWLNGVFLAADEVRISPFDRGFLFADGVYEVTAVYAGRPIDMERHLDRLERSLKEIQCPVLPDRAELVAVHERLIADNGMQEGLVYLQVTRGAYGGRDFFPPADDAIRLTQFAYAEVRPIIDTAGARDGIAVALTPDIRWGRRDIKSVQLLAPVLAKQAARNAGANDAWFVDPDGRVTEGASSNAWIVTKDGDIVTRALSQNILAGVTRHALMDVIGRTGGKIIERSFTPEEARTAAEAFITGAGTLVYPVVRVDGVEIGDGRPGPVTRGVQRLYYQAIGADPAQTAPWALPD